MDWKNSLSNSILAYQALVDFDTYGELQNLKIPIKQGSLGCKVISFAYYLCRAEV
jgi:hypothetical protein